MADKIKLLKTFGEAGAHLSRSENPNGNLYNILVELSANITELIAWANAHTHGLGAVPDQQVTATKIEVEQ